MKKQYTHARKRYVSGNILEETHLQWSKVSAASKFSQKPINRGPQSAFSADQKPICLDPSAEEQEEQREPHQNLQKGSILNIYLLPPMRDLETKRPKLFPRPTFFSAPRFFWAKTFFQTPNSFGPIIFVWAKQKFGPRIFSDQTYFWSKKLFMSQNSFFKPNIF